MEKVIIASQNPVKIESVKVGFERAFPDLEFTFEGVSVSSGISDQPMSSEETYQGAENRATNAKEKYPEADYWVGLEGGIEDTKHGMRVFGWVAIINKNDKLGSSRSTDFILPEGVAKLVRSGMELGDADDQFFNRTNSKQGDGAIGILTHGAIKRVDKFIEPVISALIPFLNPDLYEG